MTLGAIIDTILFKPLQLLFEVIYMMANSIVDNPGLSIVVLSLVMNFLVLPLYKRADAMQEEERDMEIKLRKGVSHIKKTFRGEERMMMLQTYYRQNDYKPTYVLRGAISLFLEIPFFIAAYRFLSGLQLLNGVAFGPITDLGKPDGMLFVAGVSVNILPIIMTAVNLVSCVIFTKGSSLKSKIQLYAMALFFLVFLYSSPAGLVFYWTLNNTFSLVKTIFYKIKNPARILSAIFSVSGVLIFIYGIFFYSNPTTRQTTFFACSAILMQIPLIYTLAKDRVHINLKLSDKTGNKKMFLSGALFLAVLIGALIPSAVIKASPQEFVDVTYFHNPLWFVASSFCLAIGTFVVWMGVFYWLAKPSVRFLFDRAIWVFAGIAVVDYMFFGKNLGILTPNLKYEKGLDFTWQMQAVNVAILLVVVLALWFISRHWEKRVCEMLVIGVLALSCMSVINVVNINASIKGIKEQALANKEMPNFSLSKKGKNVVVFMLDRAMAAYVPYIFNEKPELKEQFSGFTNYSNVISFGGYTNFGTPALLGGYEYTPVEINKRSDEPLVEKQNEALKVMPVVFDENDYDVTVCDPVYAGYEWIPDLSIYDEYPEIKSYITKGKFSDVSSKQQLIQNNKRNFFCYGVLKSIPLCFQEPLYDYGNYNQSVEIQEDEEEYSGQTVTGRSTAEGLYAPFMESYNVLQNLPNITNIADEGTNTFLLMTNDATHEPQMLQEPEYVPAQYVDNTVYDDESQDRFTLGKDTLKMETDWQFMHYQINMAAMIQLGKWFDYMRENGVYDNTRIILVADHGSEMGHSEQFLLDDGHDTMFFNPLLMVKDFDSEGFVTSEEFMTNGDVPTLAMRDIIKNPTNPFTGNVIDSSRKEGKQFIILSWDWDTNTNNGNTFLPAKWYSVHDDMRKKENWKVEAENAVLP